MGWTHIKRCSRKIIKIKITMQKEEIEKLYSNIENKILNMSDIDLINNFK